MRRNQTKNERKRRKGSHHPWIKLKLFLFTISTSTTPRWTGAKASHGDDVPLFHTTDGFAQSQRDGRRGRVPVLAIFDTTLSSPKPNLCAAASIFFGSLDAKLSDRFPLAAYLRFLSSL